jgi:hypothetical protein
MPLLHRLALVGLVFAAFATGCKPAKVQSTQSMPRGAGGSGGAANVDSDRNDGGGASAPGLSLPSADAARPPACTCQAGQSCSDSQGGGDKCVDDCRPGNAVPCAAPTVCDFLSGRCVPPESAQSGCVLTGTPVTCGEGEFPPRCGPGSTCEAEHCAPAAGCKVVVCDASNFCRGAECPQTGNGGNGGGVQQVSLEAIPDATAGAAGGVMVKATVKAEALCGLQATFELRKDLELYVSAYNDRGIWRVPFGGAPSIYVNETSPIGGITADRNGTLYYALQNTGVINRVPPSNGAPTPELFATPTPKVFALARMAFGPDGLLYAVADQRVFRFSQTGMLLHTWLISDSSFLTGVAFDKEGGLLAGQHWPTVWRLGPGAVGFASYLDATAAVVANALQPWNEGMALGPDGRVHVGIFPSGNREGVVYTVEPVVPGDPMAPRAQPRRLLDLAAMQRDVPETMFAGVHGVAFGVDGSLYFANQNTSGPTSQPLGQVLARRPSGKIELVAKGFNFDWPRGYDGDIVVSQATVTSVSSPIDSMGRAMGALAAPTTPGTYGVRVLVTDPRTGAIAEARATVQVK